MWYVDALWPATTAVLGVYDHPSDSEHVSSVYLDPENPALSDFYGRQGIRTAKALTRAKDYLAGLL